MQECNPTKEYPAGDSSVPMRAGGWLQKPLPAFQPTSGG